MAAPPEGWSKTLAELLAEDPLASGEEVEWARAYERQQLRSWARFPRAGDVYELTRDAEISYVTHWNAPLTSGGKGTLRTGTRVRVADLPIDAEAVAVCAEPADMARVEAELIPEKDRRSPGYAGFNLMVWTSELNRLFALVKPEDDA